MKEKVVKGHPILFSFMLGIVLTLFVAVASAGATILGFEDAGIMLAQAGAFFIMAVIVTVYMTKKDRSLEVFGFKKMDIRKEKVTLYYIPLLVIAVVQPIMGGFNLELTTTKIILILIFSLLVGYTEETIFRGIIRERLQPKGPVFYIVFSSIFFGILHMANALNGSDFIHILLQIINAFLIGLILALLIETTNNIIPLIAFHFMFDALAQMTSSNIVDKEVLVVSILNIIYLVYGSYLIFVLLRRKKMNIQISA
ncbi:CPBP family intramembrane metalloprotease [Paenibacillus sp. N3/727]|uniref:CPBP family intramembrane glutamic endopeptidase n=1 Tax=Paenibacillus sp. N3/727 TaxID=2925845 RepID=UPI001F52BCE1|nr:CPBP family intramembrane glutamic endopeptidase [Paenibacillus sp. N3/727]UNK20806.1 CPBP family intramembrane metalloprotease [Paenibacillus sp. N3/727]